jgi:hypothetical protein
MKFVSRANWKARSAQTSREITPQYGGVAIHHVGTKGKLTPSSHAKCASIVRGIQKYHMESNGWNDIAYTLLVCVHGYVFEGRGILRRTAANGSNAGNQNYYAICALVNDSDKLTKELLQGIKEGVAYLKQKGRAGSRIVGHKNLFNTDCPGTLYKYVTNGTFKPTTSKPDPNRYPGHLVKKGDSGATVKKIQNQLIKLGFKLPKYGADGDFGDETDKAVRTFQEKKKLKKDGVVGPETWKALFK